MSGDLFPYYESELNFIQQLAQEFAEKYPKIAGRLHLVDKDSADPHVERLIQAFAMLTGRIRHKIDDDFPEIVESMLNVIYPHYLRPLPPMSIAQFRFDPQQSRPTGSAEVPIESLLHTKPAGGSTATFQTRYPVEVWPLRVLRATLGSMGAASIEKAPLEAAAYLRLQIESFAGVPVAALPIDSLRFYLNGEGSAIYRIYELLLTQSISIQVRALPAEAGQNPTPLPPDSLQPVGFDGNQGVLPYSDRSFLGYRLLQEYFHFPSKFFFFDLRGLRAALAGVESAFEILIYFRDSELREHLPAMAQMTGADTFQLGCTPIVNLFERRAEPIRLTHTTTEYRVIPDLHRQETTEVYSVDEVTSTGSSDGRLTYEPFYSFRHSHRQSGASSFWSVHRRPSMRKGDEGTEVYLSLVDLNFKPSIPARELISTRVTCTNRDFVSRLGWQREWGELEGEGLPLVQARCLFKPTATLRPPLRGGLPWRLVSHLALNRLSIVQNGGLEAVQEILRLYCFSEDEDFRRRIAGIVGLRSEASVSRVLFSTGVSFVRGLDVEVDLDEEQFAGSGVYLLAAVLERFFGLYAAVNSYTRLTARSRQRRNVIRRWRPRAGEQGIL